MEAPSVLKETGETEEVELECSVAEAYHPGVLTSFSLSPYSPRNENTASDAWSLSSSLPLYRSVPERSYWTDDDVRGICPQSNRKLRAVPRTLGTNLVSSDPTASGLCNMRAHVTAESGTVSNCDVEQDVKDDFSTPLVLQSKSAMKTHNPRDDAADSAADNPADFQSIHFLQFMDDRTSAGLYIPVDAEDYAGKSRPLSDEVRTNNNDVFLAYESSGQPSYESIINSAVLDLSQACETISVAQGGAPSHRIQSSAAPSSRLPQAKQRSICPIRQDACALSLESEIWDFVCNMETYSMLLAQQVPKSVVTSDCALTSSFLWHTLPDEIWLSVFLYFTPFELCKGPARVCRHWRRICADAALWTTLDFAYNASVAAHQLCYVASRSPSLRRLSLQGRVGLQPTELLIIGQLCPLLSELDLGFCNVGLNQVLVLADSKGFQSLKSLNIEGNCGVNLDFVRALCRLPEVTSLNLSHCQVITDDEMIYLAQHHHAFSTLNISGLSFITDRAISHLVVHHCGSLTNLDLDGAELTDWSMQLVSSCRNIWRLRVLFCEQLTDASLLSIQNLTHLKSLSLRKGHQFTSSALAEMFRSQSHLNQLSYLDLSECTGLDDSVVRMICQRCQKLRELHLCWCWEVTEDGLEAVVQKCSNIHVLDLLGIDKITGSCLQDIPRSLPHLRQLDLRQCNRIIDDVIAEVVKRNPCLKAIGYYGEPFDAS